MSRKRFSVVIPTRERAETLVHALRTCTEQDFDDYEIVVCDNCSSPETRQVVEAANDSRIRYIRSDKPLAMCDNWELALKDIDSEYVTVIGDDDGLTPFALRELDKLIRDFREPAAIHWKRAIYTWPNIAIQEDADYLSFSLDRSIQALSGREQLAKTARFETNASDLPMIYNAVIHRRLLNEHRKVAGCLFPCLNPDIYSGFAFAHLSQVYVSITVPMSVAGLSGKSNGVASLMCPKGNPIAEEFIRLQTEAGYRYHPTVPPLKLIPIHNDDSFQFAKDLFFPHDQELSIDRKKATERYLAAIPDTDPQVRAEIRSKIRASLVDDPELIRWFDNEAPEFPPCPVFRLRPDRLGYDGAYIKLDTKPMGITNIYEASQMVANILCLDKNGILFDLPTREQQLLAAAQTAATSTNPSKTRKTWKFWEKAA